MRADPRAPDRWAPWVAGATVLALGLTIWEWFPPGIWHDDGVYVLLGRAISQGEGLRYSGVVGSYLAPKFPPLFPVLLAVVWSVAPDFPANALFLSATNLLLLAGAAWVFVAFVRRVFRIPVFWTLVAAALTWLSPALWRVAMVPLSEPLFILLFLLALWAGAHLEEVGGWWPLTLFVLIAAGAYHTRTIGVVLFPAVALALLVRGRGRDGALVFVFGTASVLPWLLWTRWAAERIPAPLLDTLGPYGSWLGGMISENPGHYLSFLPANAIHLLGRIVSLLLPGVSGIGLWAGVVLFPVLILGLRELGRLSPTMSLAAGAYTLVLLLWPFQDVRLLVPLQPILILGTLLGFRWILSLGALPPGGRILTGAARAGWVLAFAGLSLFRLGSGWVGDVYRVRSEALVEAVRAIQEKTPGDAVVGAPELWSGIHLFTGRDVSPSARFLPLSRIGPSWGTPEEQYRLWDQAGITHILVEHGGGVHGPALDRLDATCVPGTVQLLDSRPGQFLIRLNWDRACRRVVLEPS